MDDTTKSATLKSLPGSKPAPLGRGLSALFGDRDAGYQPAPAMAGTNPGPDGERGHRLMPVSWLEPGRYQPRRSFDQAALEELAASIREHGVLQPLLVRPLPETRDRYEIIAGERRWRASQLAERHEVPVIIRELSDAETLEIALIENLQREDLSALEEAEAYQKLIDEFHHKTQDLAKAIGKSASHVTNMMRLLALPPEAKKLLNDGVITAGHARALLAAEDPMALAHEIIRERLTVRDAEHRARRPDVEVRPYSRRTNASPIDANTLALERDLANTLGLKVKLHTRSDGSGEITVYYKNIDQFDVLFRKIKS